ncbi:MAG: hypothetical protein COX36_00760 [Candidatus Nealsonbacteria bacterium CG23_combo_of_CG06-09_8_20_14_all_38_19]|uniref:Uncharacterized protein n=1 Tax=Candidatus Nealsonbacteria bacterium CG23_combo_of_CG06-09_8_20_14_all_38_19 TaxID=1974721 RepID=A0A2G9YXK0_9BACT|nr:MAG: hypothetical protein COX36_00760 [Candidatus Nealsonbacteria bacterium CG23_combo_of_CG06-09_8_20_14_all_38_19]
MEAVKWFLLKLTQFLWATPRFTIKESQKRVTEEKFHFGGHADGVFIFLKPIVRLFTKMFRYVPNANGADIPFFHIYKADAECIGHF